MYIVVHIFLCLISVKDLEFLLLMSLLVGWFRSGFLIPFIQLVLKGLLDKIFLKIKCVKALGTQLHKIIKELYNIHLALLLAFILFRISAEDKNVTFDFIFSTSTKYIIALFFTFDHCTVQ